jgi:signal peptidase
MSSVNSSIEDVLLKKGFYMCPTFGDSMKPFLKDRQTTAYIVKADGESMSKYDIALYKRDDGTYVLHRIVGKAKDGYIMCGDNRYAKERGIKSGMILGKAKGYYDGDAYVDLESPKVRIFARFWYFVFPVRSIYLRVKFRLHRRGR